ncbi:MAG TPA: serine hydrolase domain-containing protein [Gemmatimonadaceae bacterium]|nr:serine hydrolase domain-containing protein [Gemmatimonadaceae bacterium]
MRTTLVFTIWLAVSASSFAPAFAQRAPSFPSDSSVLALLRTRVDGGTNPAIVVGLLENGKHRVIAYGKSATNGFDVDGRTLFEIGSITKVFTGTLLAHMVQRGEVKLDDPVQKFFPSSPRMPRLNGRSITLGDLATQHSGLPRVPDNLRPANRRNPYADYSADSLLAFLSRYRLTRPPGESFEYSNLGVGLLGLALARRAGSCYEALLIARMLGPLGMNDTRIILDGERRRRLAVGHDQLGRVAENWDATSLAGAGALRSTANDMLIFAAAALGAPGPLSAAFQEAERARLVVSQARRTSIGLNWFITRAGKVEIVWHNGGTGGYRSYLGLDKAGQRAVVVLTNSQNGADDIGRYLLDPTLPLANAP